MADVAPRAPHRLSQRSAAAQALAGLALVAISWAVAWSHLRPFSDESFFPLWLGYIVAVDGLVRARRGTSLLHSGPRAVARMFVVSAAMWWLFELFNLRTDNWHYLHAAPVGPVRFALEATIDFSTVLPAVFETAALVETLLPAGGATSPRRLPRLPVRAALGLLGFGVLCLLLAMIQPHYFFPLVWVCLFFIVDPVNAWRGRPSLLAAAAARDMRPAMVLALAGLGCGFLWEMWNWLSMPKWTYSVPLVPQQRLFEMPLLGYSGYIPFAFECFALYVLVGTLLGRRPSAGDAPFIPVD
jgi:hypothetical protein